jgi:hypothetical protein
MPTPKSTPESVLKEFEGQPVTALEQAFRKVVEEAQGIQSQLSDRDKRHPDGSRYGDHEYHEWRGRALAAWRHLVARQRVMKEAVKIAHRRFNPDTPLRPATELKTPEALLHAALVLMHQFQSDGVEFDEEEYRIVNAIDAYLRDHARVGT